MSFEWAMGFLVEYSTEKLQFYYQTRKYYFMQISNLQQPGFNEYHCTVLLQAILYFKKYVNVKILLLINKQT